MKKIFKKNIYILFFLALSGFIVFQLFFVNQIFELNLFAKPVLPDGFCKNCNIILISLDSLRAKSLPCYGYEQNTAPNLCEFGKKSFLFKNSYSTSSKTQDSHMSIFTSLYPSSHGMNIPFSSILNDKIVTLSQILKKENYQTYYFGPVGTPHLPLDKGLGRGFDEIISSNNPDSWIKNLQKIDIQENKFFIFMHTYFVHEPYFPKDESFNRFYSGKEKISISSDDLCKKAYEKLILLHPERISTKKDGRIDYCTEVVNYSDKYSVTLKENVEIYSANLDSFWDLFKNLEYAEMKKYTHALYAARIFELDQELKEFLEYLTDKDLLENTIIVITSDHGDEFFEHGGRSHAQTLYNEVIHVPLILYVPQAIPQTIEKEASGIDIFPSLLGLLGIEKPKKISGINLFSKKTHDFVITEDITKQTSSIITSDWQLLIVKNNSGVKRELFNIQDDPDEKNNLESDFPKIRDSLENRLHSYQQGLPIFEKSSNLPIPTWVDEEERKKLIETGYF